MTVATFTQPDFTAQSAAVYKAALDAAFKVAARNIDAFAPHQQDVGSPAPDLTVRVDAGFVLNGVTLTEVAAQTVSGFTIPSAGQERIDRIVINQSTGAATRIAGTAVTGSPSATPPAITTGNVPCCQVRLTSSDTAILNSMITDERIPGAHIVQASGAEQSTTLTAAASVTFSNLSANTFYKVLLQFTQATANGGAVTANFNGDTGAGNYAWQYDGTYSAGTAVTAGSASDSTIRMYINSSNNDTLNTGAGGLWEIDFHTFGGTNITQACVFRANSYDSVNARWTQKHGGGQYLTSNTINSITLNDIAGGMTGVAKLIKMG